MRQLLARTPRAEYAYGMVIGRTSKVGRTLEEGADDPPLLERPASEPVTDPLTDEEPPAFPLREVEMTLVSRAHYDFGGEVARGGLGRISEARDLRLDRIVAIKELLHETPSTRARFQREIAVTVKLQHPNIVAIHEAGQWPSGQLFYAMDFIVGKTLLQAIANAENLDERLSFVGNVIAVADALGFAHEHGVIHRDLKPANVLVGRFGETVVIDWGLARYAEDAVPAPREDTGPQPTAAPGVTVRGGVVGTPPYMPPEQARGETANKRADVYSLGAILYQALSGQEPYAEYKGADLLQQIITRPPVPLSTLEPDLAPDLLAIVEKAMARDPEQRYPNAEAMAEELKRFTAGRLVGAYAYRPWDLVRRFVAKHSAAVSTAAVALALLVATAVALVGRIREQRDLAEHNARVAMRERDIATSRTRDLMVSQARVQAETDPTQAVAMLKRLSGESPGALSVAARAEELGVARRVLRGHSDRVLCLAYSPDGKQLLSGSSDQSLRLWNLGDGSNVPLGEHTDQVTSCAFSKDGQSFASAGYDSQVLLYEAATLKARSLPRHSNAVKALLFSSDQQLVTASDDDTVRLWDLASFTFKRLRVPNARWPQLSFSDGLLPLVSAPHRSRARVWFADGRSAESPRDLTVHAASTLPSGSGAKSLLGLSDGRLFFWDFGADVRPAGNIGAAVTHIALASGSTQIAAVANSEGDVFRFDLQSGQLLKVSEHDQRIETLVISSEGRFIASGGWDKSVRVHDAVTSATRVLRGHTDVVSVLQFSPQGTELASGAWDKQIRLWPLREFLHEQRRVLGRHDSGAHSARFSSDGQLVASGGHDNLVRLIETETGRALEFSGHTDHVYRVLFSPDDRWLASSSDDRTIRLWPLPRENTWHEDVQNATIDGAIVLRGHEADVEELAFSPNGKRLASSSEDHTARLWDLQTHSAKLLYHDHDVTQVVFNQSGSRLATSSRAGEVRLYDGAGERLAVFREHGAEVHSLVFSPDDRWLASADISGRLLVRDLSGDRVSQLEGRIGARHLAFSPNARWLAVAGAPPHLWLCDFSAQVLKEEKCSDLSAHHSTTHNVAFAPDSKQLASAGGDGLIYLWDVESHEFRSYQGHLAPVFDLRFSPTGRQLLSASSDGTVRLWPRVLPQSAHQLSELLSALTHEQAELPGIAKPRP